MPEGVFLQRYKEQPRECAERKSEAGRERDCGKCPHKFKIFITLYCTESERI